MKSRRFLAVLFTVTMVFTLLSFTVASADEGEEAYLAYANDDWSLSYWGGEAENGIIATNAKVTGAGQYTVGLDFTKTANGKANGLQFTAAIIKNAAMTFAGAVITIDEIKVNDAAIEFAKGYSNNEDGAIRTNLYNVWVSNPPKDARTADGNLDGASAVIVDPAAFNAVETVFVTFTVTLSDGPAPVQEAYLAFANDDWSLQYWGGTAENEIIAKNATVTGAGKYTVGLDFTKTGNGKSNGLQFTAPIIHNAASAFPGAIMTIDEISVNGAPIAFTKGYSNDEDGAIRTNIYNTWVSELPKDARTADGSLEGATAVIVDPAVFQEVETVSVTFTVTLGDGTVPVQEEDEDYEMPSEFTAFLMFADDNWNWQNMKVGTAGDTAVIGDGVYIVYITKDSLVDTDTTKAAQNALVFNIDIEGLGRAMKHLGVQYDSREDGCEVEVSLEIFVDGNKINVRNSRLIYGDIEDNGKLRIEIYNEYGKSKENSAIIREAVNMEDELKVVFTLKGTGLNTGGADVLVETPDTSAKETSAPATTVNPEQADGLSTTVIIVIIAGAVIVIGLVVFFVMKKKKK